MEPKKAGRLPHQIYASPPSAFVSPTHTYAYARLRLRTLRPTDAYAQKSLAVESLARAFGPGLGTRSLGGGVSTAEFLKL